MIRYVHMNNTKYLDVKERIKLIDDIRSGKYIVKQKRGVIRKKINKKLYSEHCKLIDVLERIADVKTIGSGAYGTAYKVCMPKGCEYDDNDVESEINYAVKEVKFQDAGTYNTLINNPDRYENVEIRMLQFLSAFVYSNATPHINLPIMSFICQPSPHLSDRNPNEDLSTKRITISELADYGNLHTFMTSKLKLWKYNETGWKVLFFQILSVLTTIQRYYPNFLHNDFKLDNILVRATNDNANGYFKYSIKDEVYYIPNIGFQIMLWDFDFSCIAGKIDNDKLIAMIDESDANLTVHRNQYYDIHMCFGLMYRYWSSYMPNNIVDWLQDYLLNDQIPSAQRDERVLEAKEYTTPAKLLLTPLFDQFRTLNGTDNVMIDHYTGTLEENVEYDFGNDKNRYTNPDTCQYQQYIFLDPKKPTKEQYNDYKNRYLCLLASDSKQHIKSSTLPSEILSGAQKWVNERMKEYTISSVLSNNEKRIIMYTTLNLFNKFCNNYNVTSNLVYAVLCSSLMYSSFNHLLSYVFPFNDFSFWYTQPMLNTLNPGDLEDVYKQFTAFIADYIENI